MFRTLAVAATLVVGLLGPASAGYPEGLAAYTDGDFAKAMKQLTPLAEDGDALAQTYVGLMYERGEGVDQDLSAALKWLLRAAQSGQTIAGTISAFDCGDNCYLTIETKSGKEVGLCIAKACEPWNDSAEIPKSLIGKKIKAAIGIGEQFDGSGTSQGRMLAFGTLKM